MSQRNKDLVREFYEAIDAGNTARVGQLCTPTATFQFGSAPAIPVAQFIGMIVGFGGGASRHVVRDLVAEGDKLACHVDVVSVADGRESTAKALTLFTFAGGSIASELVVLDRGLPA